ncbi:MAG: TonB-dependent receptor, partial [Rickettsiales bacterium]|nr:TonB-dependent receptor [Rickettsiales bacterium]
TEKDGNDTTTLSANVQSKLTERFTAKLNTRYNRTNTEFDSPGSFIRPIDDPAADNDSRQFNGGVAGELSSYNGDWVQEASVSTLNLNRQQVTVFYDALGNELFGRQQQHGTRQTVDWVHRLKVLGGNTLTVGGEAYSDHFKTNSLREVNNDNKAIFADQQIEAEEFFINLGVRQDYNQAFGKQFTWKVAPGLHVPLTGTTLKATYGKGFKAPSLSQLFDPSYGNSMLQPETSDGWDAGFEQKLFKEALVFGATAFRNNISQLIGNNPAPPYASINVGKARTEGVESSFTYTPAEAWSLNANHTYTLSQNKTKDTELLRRPRHEVNAGATYQYSDEGDVSVNARYLSARRDVDINFPYGGVYVKSFTTVNLRTNYAVTPNVSLYGRLDNLLDKRYEEVFAYGQPGRSFFAGVKASY